MRMSHGEGDTCELKCKFRPGGLCFEDQGIRADCLNQPTLKGRKNCLLLQLLLIVD